MSLLGRIKHAGIARARQYKRKSIQKALSMQRYLFSDKSGINLIGFFSYTMGIAEVGRFFALKASKAAVPLSIYDVNSPYPYNKLDAASLQEYQRHYTYKPKYARNIFFINADYIPLLKQSVPELFIGRYNAAVFFWEFDDYFYFPQAFGVIDEVIAFTEFIATAVRKAAPAGIKVTKMPFPFYKSWTINHPPAEVRKRYGIRPDSFVFIFNFDFESVYDRKNPEAILQAFGMAFTTTDNVYLILKTINANTRSANYARFQDLIKQVPIKEKIIQVNENLERDDFMSMINASDCYVSLHRSEGLGLGMMEAMSMGKPVIATNYGGNTDFMRANNSLLVNFTLRPLAEDAGPYKSGWIWAEPDVAEAASYMTALYNDRGFALKLGKQAAASINTQFGNDVFEKSLAAWLQ